MIETIYLPKHNTEKIRMLHITDIIVVEEEEIERNVEVSVNENERLTQPLVKRPDQKRPQEKKGLSLKLAKI